MAYLTEKPLRWSILQYVGTAFIQRGGGKLDDIAGLAAKYHLPWVVAATTMLVQMTGGALLIIGVLTPMAALGIAGTMAGAVLKPVLRIA